jgi:mono/diheme cytochrome c family protein
LGSALFRIGFVMKILITISTLLFSATFVLAQEAVHTNAVVTPVSGESWLRHLHRSFGNTSMGKTWRLGPANLTTDQAAALPSTPSDRNGSRRQVRTLQLRTLHGSDLYRLNCQGCHGESGLGAPPEIGSLIDPVRATSVALVEERMKKIGMTMSRRQIAEMTSQSKAALLKRLHEGGTDMPSFGYLSDSEIRSLIAYLQMLAGVPGAENGQIALRESHARVGELIVKSTCHVCHSATGMNPTSAEFLDGAIPPLSVLPHRVNRAQLVRKVTAGAPIVAETTSYRGRMPVFNHLSEDEAADVYDYLTEYPPVEAVQSDPAQSSATAAGDSWSDPGDPEERLQVPSQVPSHVRLADSVVLPVATAVFVLALLVLGFWFTVHECTRISRENQPHTISVRRVTTPAPLVTLRPRVEMAMGGPNLPPESLAREFGDWWDDRKIS